MTAIDVTVDSQHFQMLKEMASARGIEVGEMASRLLRRATRAAQPKPVYDIEVLKAYAAEFEAEELALAGSDPVHRLELLEAEDRAR